MRFAAPGGASPPLRCRIARCAVCVVARRRTTSPTTSRSTPSSSPPGDRALPAGARAARGDARSRLSRRADRAISILRAPMRRCATRSSCGSPTTSTSSKTANRFRLPRIADCARVARLPTNPSRRYERRLAHLKGPRLAARHGPLLEPAAHRRAVRISDPVRALGVRHPPARRPVGSRSRRRCASCRRRRDARLRVPRRSGPGAARSALAPGGAALRRVRLPAHPRRHRPPAVPALPRASVPAAAAARRDRHRIHGRRTRSP